MVVGGSAVVVVMGEAVEGEEVDGMGSPPVASMLGGVGEARELGVPGVAGLFPLARMPLAGKGGKEALPGCANPCGDGAGESRGFFEGGWFPNDVPGWEMGDGVICVAGEKVRCGTCGCGWAMVFEYLRVR